MMMQLEQAQEMLRKQGVPSTLVGFGQLPVRRVHTDTRSIEAGDLFLALRGEHFDGHDFLGCAREAGVTAVIAEAGIEEVGLSGLLVKDTRQALGALSSAWREQFDLPLIAVTGSNGKTTVTQMVAGILRAWHGTESLATKGNFNNDIGVPLTLFGLNRNHRSAVVELGMNHPGEIAVLAAYAQPTVAVVNNAQREHQEFMHTVDAVAQENGAVIAALPADGVAVFPSGSQYAGLWRNLAGMRRCWTFGMTRHGGVDAAADVTASASWQDDAWQLRVQTPAGAFASRLHVAGLHNVKNALAAVAATLAAGAPLQAIADGLRSFRAVKGRSQTFRLHLPDWQVTVVDDTYNANPDSMCAAVDVLAELPGPHLLVLGDMGEVGDDGEELHAELGEYAMEKGIETLYCTGELMRYCAAFFPDARHFGSMLALKKKCDSVLRGYRSVLIKGSRFMHMEQVVEHLAQVARQQIVHHAKQPHPSNPSSLSHESHQLGVAVQGVASTAVAAPTATLPMVAEQSLLAATQPLGSSVKQPVVAGLEAAEKVGLEVAELGTGATGGGMSGLGGSVCAGDTTGVHYVA